MGIALKLQITLGSMAIFKTLILPNHEHRMFFHLFVPLFPWAVVCSSPWRGPLHPLLVVFLFYSLCNKQLWSLHIIWLSVSLLLVYRNACDFCTLILYPETLLKLLISFRRFWLRWLGLPNIKSCCLQIETIWIPLFLIEYPLFLFLAWFLWLELPVLYWIGVLREVILV